MTKYNLNLDTDNDDYYYHITRNKNNHLVQRKVDRPLSSKDDVMRLSTIETYDTINDVSPVIVNDCLEELKQQQLQEQVTKVLSTLTPREERVIRMRFGIGLNTDYTLEEVGQVFSVTRDRIRQIEAKALRKLKHPDRSKMLQCAA